MNVHLLEEQQHMFDGRRHLTYPATAAANGSNGRVLDGPIIEPVNFLLDFPFESGNM